MFDSEEEYVMEFKAEEKRAQLVHFDLEDTISNCSTLSASEVDSSDSNDIATPPLKRIRVMMKKLPRKVLAKYKISCKDTTPLRSSGRIKSKHIPVGQYLALHNNKPLDEVMNKKKIQRKIISNIVEKTKHKNQKSMPPKKTILPGGCSSMKKKLKSTNLSNGSSSKLKYFQTSKSAPNISSSLHSRRHLKHRSESTNNRTKYTNKTNALTTTPCVGNRNNNVRSLHERIAATRIKEKPRGTCLPKLPDVVITRYDIPPSSRNEAHVAKIVLDSTNRNNVQNGKTEPFITSYPKLCCPQNVRSKVFPAFITPSPSANQSPYLLHSKGAVKTSNDPLKYPAQRKFTIQAFKMPDDVLKTKDPVPVSSPRVFVVNQSLLEIDPLNITNTESKPAKYLEKKIPKENIADNGAEVFVDSDSDLELIDAEKSVEPEVIKRIIYHNKSAQTKFTCNGSICGLVDSDKFNLNCFYCYEIFPLHKWLEFKVHIKVVHQVEERADLSDSDLGNDSTQSRNLQENCCQTLSPISRNMNDNGKQSYTTKALNTTQVYNKLPLEPRLVAQRQNEMFRDPSKFFSPAAKTSETSAVVYQSEKLNKNMNFINRPVNEIISLDSDDGDLNVNDLNKTLKRNRYAEKMVINPKARSNNNFAQVGDSRLSLASMPHIIIKKVSSANENIDATKPASELMHSNEKFIKIPSSTNIQKVIKALPKSAANQLSANDNTRPRYFVVKRIIKLPETEEAPKVPDLNIPKGAILTKMPLESKKSASMASTGDSVPKPTSGLGILFGSTNSMVVIEFLLKLKTFPELWLYQLKNDDPVKYNESIKKLCFHINNRFGLNMTEYEMLISIQRVREWYYLMLQSIREHNKGPNNTKPYKHRFPIYFKILSQFLKPDVDEKSGIQLNEISNKTTTLAANTSMASANVKAPLDANETFENTNIIQPPTIFASTPNTALSNKDNTQNQEVTADNLIEFDADTLYDQESSDKETLKEFNESKLLNKKTNKKIFNADGTERKRTKVYLGSFECDICNKVFKRACDLRRHRVYHFPPQFECGLCSQKFHFQHRADRCSHIKKTNYIKVDKASGEKRIWPKKIFRFNMICEICGNSYRSIGSLNTHKRDKHFNQRNTCIVCNFTALSNWRIVQHQRKRHIVEPGLPEEIAKKSRARTESKSAFSNEARQAFDWRREMRKKMKPGEKFYGCCRCKIIFNTRKEKVLHNKIEHPITEFTVFCLLCLPNKLLLSNANCARRHYIDIHKVPWHEIDELVRCTKPIFNLLNKEEIELLKASENYKELLDELLKDKKMQSVENFKILDDEASKAVENLPHLKELDVESTKIEVECSQEQNVYVDGITDKNHYRENNYKQLCYEHDYSEEHIITETFNEFDVLVSNHGDVLYSQQSCEERPVNVDAAVENNGCGMENYIQNEEDCKMDNYIRNNGEYAENIIEDFVEAEMVEESLVVEEYIDEIIGEDEFV